MTKYPQIAFTEIATLIRGVSYDKKVASLSAKDDYIPILRANNIQKDLILNDLVYVPSDLVKKEQMIREGDIVLAMSSGSKDLVGKSAQANRDIDAAFGTFCGLIRAKENVDSKFLGLYFQTQEYRNFVSYQSKGVNICNLKKKDIESLQIPLPPLPTQRAIVARIEALFAELDKAAEHLRTAQQQLKTYRQAVLNHWLNNDEGKWEMVKLGEVAEIKGGKRLPKGHYYSEKPTEYRYIMAGNLKNSTVSLDTNFIEKATYEALKHYEVIGGEVYITIVGACIGDVGIIPANLGCSILTENAAKIVNMNNLTPDFLTIVLRSSFAKTQIKSKILSATLGKLALSRVAEIVVPLPPLPEQQRIVQEIESRLSQAEAAEASIAEALQKTEALRQSILKKAFSGEFDL